MNPRSTPSKSPHTHSMVMPGSTLNAYGDSSPELSITPISGHNHMFPQLDSLPYDQYQYPGNTANFSREQKGVHVKLPGSNPPDERDRRRRRSALEKEKEAISSMHMRRRAQNRASQRAFRDRKEKHLEDLENTLEDLGGKHQSLFKSYSNLSALNEQLSDEVEKLTAENEMLRSSRGSSTISALLTPGDCDSFGVAESFYPTSAYYFDENLWSTPKVPSSDDGMM